MALKRRCASTGVMLDIAHEKLSAAEPDDQVVRTEVLDDQRDDAPE
jgi:hypothetical protein